MFAPSAVVTTPVDIPQMVATPAPAAAAGSVQSVWSPLLGTNPGVPVESPLSWSVVAAARRQLGRAKAAVTPAVSVSTGQVLASAVTASAVTVSPPVISSVTLGTPNASTGAVVGTVKATDPGKYTLTYKATTSSKGSVSITTTGVFTYTPTATTRHAAAQNGAASSATSDTVTVTVTNSKGVATSLVVTVPISAANTAPVPTRTVGTPHASTGVVTGSVTATDANSDPLTYTVTANPTKGTVSFNTSTKAFNYTPTTTARHNASATTATTADKTDTFTVTVNDGYGGVVAVPVSVTISPTNTGPTAGTTAVGIPNTNTGIVTGNLTATDSEGDALTYSGPPTTTKGSVTVNSNGSFTYTPTPTARQEAGPTTTDTFIATVTDGHGGSTPITVKVNVDPGTTPTAGMPTVGTPDPTSGAVSGNAAFNDPSGRVLTYTTAAKSTGGGTVTLNSTTGAYSYTPTATQRRSATATTTDTFTVTASNGIRTAAETVTVPVDAGTPVLGTPAVGTLTTSTGVISGGRAVLTDPAGRALTYKLAYPISVGGAALTIDSSTGTYTYTPTKAQRLAATTSTTDTFTVIASNGVNTATQNITVPVSAIIDTPTAGQPTISLGSVTQSYTGNIGDVVTGNAGFTDAAGRALTYSAPATSTGGGTVTIDSFGNFTYTPTTAQRKAAGVNTRTTDTFTVTANNGVNTASQTITVPVDPTFTSLSVYARGPMVISPDGKYLYVPVTNAIAVINTATNTTAPSLTSLPNVTAMAINPSGSDLYEALNGLAGSIANIPVSLGRPKTTFAALNGYVTSLAVSPDGKTLYAADLSGTVSVISTATFQATRGATVSSGPTAIAVSPDGSRLYVAGGREGTVTVVNTATNAITSTIPVGVSPTAAAVSPDGSRLYVANTNSVTVSVINTATNAVTNTITVGGFTLRALAISPDAKYVYVLGETGNNQSVTVINTAANAVTNTIVLDTGGQDGGSLAISPDGRQLYVSTGTAVNTIKIA